MQCVVALAIGAANVFFPMAAQHTAIHAGVYLAVFIQLHINRVAGKFKLVQRVAQQLLLFGHTVLFPFALQIVFAPALQVGVWRAGG